MHSFSLRFFGYTQGKARGQLEELVS